MKIRATSDEQLKAEILQELKDNDGYCPCRLEHAPENKCMCQEFLNQGIGPCYCGLYIKEEE